MKRREFNKKNKIFPYQIQECLIQEVKGIEQALLEATSAGGCLEFISIEEGEETVVFKDKYGYTIVWLSRKDYDQLNKPHESKE